MAFYFFTEPHKLQNQISGQEFGAIDENNFRLGNMFSALPSEIPKAFAVTEGLVLVQQLGTTDSYSIILKPSQQPDLGLPKIDFIIYKGIKKESLLDAVDFSKVAPEETTDLTRLIHQSTQLWFAEQETDIPNTEPAADTSLGLAYSSSAGEPEYQKLDSDPLNNVFYSSNNLTLPFVFGGNYLGDFDTSSDFGIMIVFEKVGFQPTFQLSRELNSELTFNALPITPTNAEAFKRRHEKEEILAFMDSTAFFGAFSSLGIQVYNDGFIEKAGGNLYTDVIEKHFSRNKLYLDIRNEYDDSYNYYQNYDDTVRLSLDGTDNLINVEYYRNDQWPVLAINDSEFNVNAGDNKVIRLSLPNQDNEFPLVYLKRAYREDLGLEELPENTNKFLTPIQIQNVTVTDYVRLNQNLIVPQSNDQIFANYYQLKYIKRFKVDNDSDSNNDNTTVGNALFKRVYLDNLFPVFDMHIPFVDTSYTNLKIYSDASHIDKLLVKDISQNNIIGNYTLRDYTSSIGIAKDANYVAFISFPFSYNNNINYNNDVLPLTSLETGNDNLFLVELNNLISSIDLERSEFTHNNQTVGFLRFVNNQESESSNFIPTNYNFNDIIILSVTTQEYTTLENLKNTHFPDGYKVYLGVKDITPIVAGGNTYFSFEYVLRGLREQNDDIETHVVDTGIISYTDAEILGIDSGHVFPVGQAYIEEDYGESRPGSRSGIHEGIDIETTSDAATPGSPVYAAMSGTVEWIIKANNAPNITNYLSDNGGTDSNAGGVRVRIRAANGLRYYYMHLTPGSNDHLNLNSVVNIGDQIGTIGRSGYGQEISDRWEQYHLHFEIWDGPNYTTDKINPYTAFPELALLPFDIHRGD
jgi:hypothetical protein